MEKGDPSTKPQPQGSPPPAIILSNVEQVLSEIDANSTKKLYIYNKIDKISDQDEIPSGENIVKISAKRNIGHETIKKKILSLLWED